jgi:hypothetical protein
MIRIFDNQKIAIKPRVSEIISAIGKKMEL